MALKTFEDWKLYVEMRKRGLSVEEAHEEIDAMRTLQERLNSEGRLLATDETVRRVLALPEISLVPLQRHDWLDDPAPSPATPQRMSDSQLAARLRAKRSGRDPDAPEPEEEVDADAIDAELLRRAMQRVAGLPVGGGPQLTEGTLCKGCGSNIDPDTCGCGIEREHHTGYEDHPFIPAGCDCHRS